MREKTAVMALLCIVICFRASGDELPALKHITQYGITWEFEKEIPVGQFVNGDYYVVGPVSIISIDPPPENGRNGSVLNQPVNRMAGYDDRIQGGLYDPDQEAKPPFLMSPGDALISTISGGDPNTNPRLLRIPEKSKSPVRTAAVLTCLSEPVPPDAFRPGYCDRDTRIYLARNLRRHILPKLQRVESTPSLEFWEGIFQKPWLDTVPFGFAAPYENMPSYGREVARSAGFASLLLCIDFSAEEKEKLLINFIQVGIDLWSAVNAGHPGWPAQGGLGNGRKWIIVLSGMLLGDEDIQSPYTKYPEVQFSEDMQTMYGSGWTGATALYAGHMGKDGNDIQPGWGPYEHLHPSQWIDLIGENYRRSSTSQAWVGEALAARILHAEDIWDHPAFFDYVDRWMTEDDMDFIEIIKDATGKYYSEKWIRQRQTVDKFFNDMWSTHRNNLPEPVKVNQWEHYPDELKLKPPYPNPFNSNTSIEYILPYDTQVELTIYNALGQAVNVLKNNTFQPAGSYSVIWDAQKLSSGLYFCMMKTERISKSSKMLLIK